MTAKPEKIEYIKATSGSRNEMELTLLFDCHYNLTLFAKDSLSLIWVNESDIDIHNINIDLGTYLIPDEGV